MVVLPSEEKNLLNLEDLTEVMAVTEDLAHPGGLFG